MDTSAPEKQEMGCCQNGKMPTGGLTVGRVAVYCGLLITQNTSSKSVFILNIKNSTRNF